MNIPVNVIWNIIFFFKTLTARTYS